MKVRFNGMILKKTKGCGCSGKTSSLGMTAVWGLTLPSGTHKVFRKGHIEEVTEEDADFLLDYEYTQDGTKKKAFEVV